MDSADFEVLTEAAWVSELEGECLAASGMLGTDLHRGIEGLDIEQQEVMRFTVFFCFRFGNRKDSVGWSLVIVMGNGMKPIDSTYIPKLR